MKKNILKKLLFCGFTLLISNFLNAKITVKEIQNDSIYKLKIEFFENNQLIREPIEIVPTQKLNLADPIQMPITQILHEEIEKQTKENRVFLVKHKQNPKETIPLSKCEYEIVEPNLIKINIQEKNTSIFATLYYLYSLNEQNTMYCFLYQESIKKYIPYSLTKNINNFINLNINEQLILKINENGYPSLLKG